MSDAAQSENGRIPDDELIADLLRVADDLGETPTCDEYQHHGRHSRTTLQNRFGSWLEALEAAGLSIDDRTTTRGTAIPDDELIADLQRVADDLGQIPSSADYAANGTYSRSTLRYRFGGWDSALAAAGFEPKSRGVDDTSPPEFICHRKYGTIEVFEDYWVLGKTVADIPVNISERGIPARDAHDATALQEGRARVDDLWEDYLTDFQQNLAHELWALRYGPEGVGADE